MKEAVTKVIDTLTQKDFHGAFQNNEKSSYAHKFFYIAFAIYTSPDVLGNQ